MLLRVILMANLEGIFPSFGRPADKLPRAAVSAVPTFPAEECEPQRSPSIHPTTLEAPPILLASLLGLGAALLLFCTLAWSLHMAERSEEVVALESMRPVSFSAVPAQEVPAPSPEAEVEPESQPLEVPLLAAPSPDAPQLRATRIIEQARASISPPPAHAVNLPDLPTMTGPVSFEALSQLPRVIQSPPIQFPRALRDRGIYAGEVRLLIEIDEEGVPSLIEILGSSDPSLEAVATRTLRGIRFTRPHLNGRSVAVRGEWPLRLEARR